mgnify:CR=1 FL=1
MSKKNKITIVEVGTRDGMQIEKKFISTKKKIKIVDMITNSGIQRIEVTSFVSPKHVPQLSDAKQVMENINRKDGVEYEALVPNLIGMERALECDLDRISFFVSSSETFNNKNLRASRSEMIKKSKEIAKIAIENKIKIRGSVVTAFGCPYEGSIPFDSLEWVIKEYLEMGCDEICLADTVGMSNPEHVKDITERMRNIAPDVQFALHFHNTRGLGLANVYAGLKIGIKTFDSSVGGLGGSPFAPKATGNISTEDTVNMLQEMGYNTNINLEKIIRVVSYLEKTLSRQLPGQLLHAGKPKW